jgi:hypothetical protein
MCAQTVSRKLRSEDLARGLRIVGLTGKDRIAEKRAGRLTWIADLHARAHAVLGCSAVGSRNLQVAQTFYD